MMNKIYKIAQSELKCLFYSPIAWLSLAIFAGQSAFSFLEGLENCRANIAMGINIPMITTEVFSQGLFSNVAAHLYLYIPLLTMGLMSRETSSGSIKLLQSAPVKIREIILGKYLGMMIYGFLLILILLVYCLVGFFTIKSLDISLLLPGLLSIYLLICAYVAIGLFLSCLTSYQVVAAVSTLATFAALSFIGTVGQDVDFIRDLTSFLSISGRTHAMITGLLASKDVIYFILIIILFLCLSIFRLQSERAFNSNLYVTGKYALLFFTVLVLGYVTSRPSLVYYKDMTATKFLTLTPNSLRVVEQLKGPFHVTTYVNLLSGNLDIGLPTNRNRDAVQLLDYQRLIPGFEHRYVYYYDYSSDKGTARNFVKGPDDDLKASAEKFAETLDLDINDFLPPAKIRTLINLKEEDNRLVRRLAYNGKSTFLRFFNDPGRYADEAEITAAIRRLLTVAPKIAFVTGNQERSIDKAGDRDYAVVSSKDFRNSLVNQGFDIISLDLRNNKIPEGLSALVLADPTVPLSIETCDKIKVYLNSGGNMLIAGEPGRQSLLNPVLASIGLSLSESMVINQTADYAPDLIFGQFAIHADQVDSSFKLLKELNAPVALSSSTALEIEKKGDFRVEPILISPVSATLGNNTGKGAPLPLMMALTRKRNNNEQRILVSGDADFMSNIGLQREKTANFNLMTGIFKWFSNGELPINTQRPEAKDNIVLASRESISMMKMIMVWITPGLLLAVGGTLLILRKRR
ncbi:Gldg family protein [Pedobacter hiemivivus]|uniref:ABC transporter permease n=1 Tax=Pedobacter hiemivivus TaxID=2530454 RepID=A0A4R0NC32_9SPHI|nr:Gldg family protein [Pedobacter hiemivivus]TCC96552.1 ABC transporter permease [Pedobacter hiemivivus]